MLTVLFQEHCEIVRQESMRLLRFRLLLRQPGAALREDEYSLQSLFFRAVGHAESQTCLKLCRVEHSLFWYSGLDNLILCKHYDTVKSNLL